MASSKGRYMVLIALIVAAVAVNYALRFKREQQQMSAAYQEAKVRVEELESERETLAQEIAAELVSEIQGDPEAETASPELSELQKELTNLKGQLDQALSELSLMQTENEELMMERRSLLTQVKVMSTEREHLRQKMNSVDALQESLAEVKAKIRREQAEKKKAKRQARIAAQKDQDERESAEGNGGLVVRNGESTISSSPRMRIRVLQPQRMP